MRKKIESLFAKFLWTGPDLIKKIHEVSWEDICKPTEGGLNIRRVKDKNTASSMKHLWWLAKKNESLWVKWIHAKYLKRNSIWTIKTPNNCSWSWRKLLKLRDRAEYMKSIVGNGQSTYLWLDNWHPNGERIRYDSRLDRITMLNRILLNGEWCSFLAVSTDIMEVQSLLSRIEMLHYDELDTVVWIANPNGIFPPAWHGKFLKGMD